MRQNQRVAFRSLFRVKVYDRPSGKLIGYAGDLSEGGLRLVSDQLVEVGSCLRLRLRMRGREERPREAELDATCLWVRENPRTGHYEAGLRLNGATASFTDFIQSLLADRGLQPSAE